MAIRNIIRKAEQEYPSTTTPGDIDLSTIEELISQQAVIKSTDTYIVAEPEDNLATKYNEAKALTPNGQAKSSTNRACLIIMPGNYSLSSELAIDAQYVDIIGLGAQKLEKGAIPAVTITGNTFNVTANDVRVQGISVGSQAFKIGNDLPLQRFEDCVGGDESFGGNGGQSSGTFTNCIGGNYSFGGGFTGIASGIFTNCIAQYSSFGGYGLASGTFINCLGGDECFGITSSGTFTGCIGSSNSFSGSSGVASGTFTDCIAGNYSFGGNAGIANGIFTNCIGGLASFGGDGGIASGTFTDCRAGDISFGSLGAASGIFIRCIAGTNSFGDTIGNASGTFIDCIGGDGNFGGNGGTASGTFTNCIAGLYGFGGLSGFLTGKFFECRLTSGTFEPVSGGGLMRNCIDGNNDIIDQ
jgi:hypothetical protein